MNHKKVNWAFLGMVVLHFAAVAVLDAVSGFHTPGIAESVILSELLLVIPAVIVLIISHENWKEFLAFRGMKFLSVLMVLLYTFLMMPLATLLNAVSMLFVDNAVGAISGEVMELPFLISFFLIAIWGPVCEEFVFRGVICRGYQKDGSLTGSILMSSLLFGLIHMNFNQAPYAFGLGIAMALVMEASGTILAPMLMHVVFNGQSVIQMYAMEHFVPGMLEEQMQMEFGMDEMAIVISIYAVLALICTVLAICVLVWICKNEKREDYLLWLHSQRGKQKQIWSIPVVIGIAVCLGYMVWMAVLQQ